MINDKQGKIAIKRNSADCGYGYGCGYDYGYDLYPESDWQLFKQCLNVWFDFADDDYYRERLPFRFSRSKLALNMAALIRDHKARIEDLKSFSRDLQWDVRALLCDVKGIEEMSGLKYGGSYSEDGEDGNGSENSDNNEYGGEDEE